MIAIAFLFIRMLRDFFKSRRRLEAEILVLRHQLNVLQHRAPRRLHLRWADRAGFNQPSDLQARSAAGGCLTAHNDPRHLAQLAKRMIDITSGEIEDRGPTTEGSIQAAGQNKTCRPHDRRTEAGKNVVVLWLIADH